MNQVFKLKNGWWLFSFILLLAVGVVGLLFRAAALPLVLPLALMIVLLLCPRYPLPAPEIASVCGLRAGQMPRTRLPVRTPLSSPAPSPARLEVRYGKYNSALAWPLLAALLRLNPAIRHD
ncbi:hypothetical protein [Hymenobacter sp. DG01]|uniref:hypothetical protein n=1 Tax=Hymenobacter sp. DG01 TaxID=2584940 RepID=UPI00111FD1CC|nr:hypothetical protein [Hymenobacter sp. DG01]